VTTTIGIAFLPLTDCAVLAAAVERGFAEEEGLDVHLVRDTSWATVRDRLIFGQVQAAHMLAPLAVAVTLGLSQHGAALLSPFKLGLNGNLVVIAPKFAAQLPTPALERVEDPGLAAREVAAAAKSNGARLVFGVVHRFSSHALMLRYWLASAGMQADRDYTLRILPPSLMGDALRTGEIDGFCAGEPWGSIAVASGVGEVASAGARIWQRGVEKLLTLRKDWAEENSETVIALVRALDRAAAWCDDRANAEALAEILARDTYVGAPVSALLPALTGSIQLSEAGATASIPDLLLFHRESANFPWRSQGLWIYSQLVRWGFIAPSREAEAAAAEVFRPDLYRLALAGSATPLPGASAKLEGALAAPLGVGTVRGRLTLGPDRFFDGRIFDPEAIESYLAGFAPSQ
jgi:two-component system, oxyanion-binding sensor